VIEAADLLYTGLCSPRCLLAMETPPGWCGCACPCDGRYHAALVFAPVQVQYDIRDQHGNRLGSRPTFARAS
jgi:hypothetical protein